MRKEIDYTYFSKEQIEAAKMMATSEVTITVKEVAEHLGVSDRTVYRWKKDKKWLEMYQELCEQEMDMFLGEAYRYLKKGVKTGSVKFLELYLKRSGKLIDRKEVTNDVDITVTSIEGKTNEQLRKEAIEMEKKLIMGKIVEADVIEDA